MPEACISQESIIVGTSISGHPKTENRKSVGSIPRWCAPVASAEKKKSSETVANTEKGADDESEEGEEESDGRETGNSKSDIKTESEENKESSSIPS